MDDPFSAAQLAQNFESSRDGAVCAVCQTDGEQNRPDRSSQSEVSMTGTKCEVVDTRAKSREQLSPQSRGLLARRKPPGTPWARAWLAEIGAADPCFTVCAAARHCLCFLT